MDAPQNYDSRSEQNGGTVSAVAPDTAEQKTVAGSEARLKEQLEKVSQELKDFAYTISHDLKAPLRGIKALTDWLVADYSDKLGEEGKEQMKLLITRVNRMNNLIDGVLQYSRVGRIREEYVRIDLNELLRQTIESIAPPKNIEITVEKGLPVIVAEKTYVRQVFENLLGNAVKFMDKPQGIIKVGCVEDSSFWKFNVTDNGPGIEQKDFERIFKIFQTLHARDEIESTGAGLTIAKKIVELYGGKIWLESQVGKGTTFFFTLPKSTVEREGQIGEALAQGKA
jgi:light-regulated signal transduction histidine kinase (bacteriophytochrome)